MVAVPPRETKDGVRHRRTRLLDLAVLDNARWCHLVSATWGAPGTTDEDAWTSATRTPPGYPDAVTLRPGVSATELLSRIDTSAPGCSVKDSYADLDLSPHGFQQLFSATWIGGSGTPSPPPPGTTPWQPIGPGDLGAWQAAWAGQPDPEPRFRPELLAAVGVTLLGARRGRGFTAGCVLTGDDSAVGVSNVFDTGGALETAWHAILRWTALHHPAKPVVGYEMGADLAAALHAGLRPLGPLTVWAT
ncbi:hypothetical protein [Actinotalea sp. K2]|uniref:hypothetical protein n=1 Tax=Actinotalea sp. K2 TaxID=2939438 RepID=UPI002017FEE6|nr:hypothetical protein [Actinotalea sp. K2]MCL3861068.1 hypothetical protein [Actinotalea sp. K2]